MSHRRATSVGLASLLLVGVFTGCASPKTSSQAAAAALGHYVQLLRRQDAAGLAELFCPDGSMDHAGQKPIVGRPAIRAFLESFASYKVLTHEMRVDAFTVDGSRSLTQVGSYHQTVRAPDGQVIEVKGSFMAEWERQGDGRWLIRRMHTAPPDEATTGGGSKRKPSTG